jgi:hypothetical protein
MQINTNTTNNSISVGAGFEPARQDELGGIELLVLFDIGSIGIIA